MIIIVFAIPILLILLGILIKYFKQYWLIAGYNTASQEEKEKINVEKLGNFIGNILFFLAAINLSGLLLKYFGYKLIGDLTWGLFIIAIIFMIIKGQSFYKDGKPAKRKMNRITIIIVLSIMLPVLVFVFGLIGYGITASKVIIDGELIQIRGMYEASVLKEAVTSIELLDEIPKIEGKVNGFDFGHINKGVFKIKDWGNGRLYLQSNKGPYLLIRYNTEEFILINYKNPDETIAVYKMISDDQ